MKFANAFATYFVYLPSVWLALESSFLMCPDGLKVKTSAKAVKTVCPG